MDVTIGTKEVPQVQEPMRAPSSTTFKRKLQDTVPSACEIARLGTKLDQVDAQFSELFGDGTGHVPEVLCIKHFHASQDYFGAARVPVLAAREKLLAAPPRADDGKLAHELGQIMIAAQQHRATLLKAGSEFSTERERLDAACAEELAESNFEIVCDRWLERKRARRAGRIKRATITDGYVSTGKTVLVDGERVPVVHRVRSPQ